MMLIMIGFISSQSFAQEQTKDADFNYQIDESRPNIVQFYDLTTGGIISWNWNFNDNPEGGSYSNEQNPRHIFPQNGDYQVLLNILASDSVYLQITKTIHIEVPLIVDFTFHLDSLNRTPNTFVFNSHIEGFYDNTIWNFNNEIIQNMSDTTHSYPEQDEDYQVSLTAQYIFNDTSILKKTLYKGLTTSEYFDIGGQVYFGDSLMNNPYSTGDTAIAYLYRVDENQMTPIDTSYYHQLGYYWFDQELKAYYIIKTGLTPHSSHFADFAPTYVGNTTNWGEAEIINLARNKYREDIHLIEKSLEKTGDVDLEGHLFDIIGVNAERQNAVVYLFDMDESMVDYQYVNSKGEYIFENVYKGHYMLSADVTGIPVRPQLIYVDGKYNREFKSTNINSEAEIFPNPAQSYSILSFNNPTESRYINLQIIAANGIVMLEKQLMAVKGNNFYSLELQNYAQGIVIVKIIDGDTQKIIKLLHY